MFMLALALVSGQLHDVARDRASPHATPATPPAAVAVPLIAVTHDEAPDEAPRRRLWGLSILGGCVGMTAYIAGAVEYWRASWVISDGLPTPVEPRSGWLMLPLLGPWLALTDPSTARSDTTGLAIASGLAQLLGLGLSIFGPLITIDGAAVTVAPTGASGTF
jgi:hypothetical protein